VNDTFSTQTTFSTPEHHSSTIFSSSQHEGKVIFEYFSLISNLFLTINLVCLVCNCEFDIVELVGRH
jgi:hypothetical protein